MAIAETIEVVLVGLRGTVATELINVFCAGLLLLLQALSIAGQTFAPCLFNGCGSMLFHTFSLIWKIQSDRCERHYEYLGSSFMQ